MVKSKAGRREKESPKLDIDRRKVTVRREEARRQFIDEAYETVYIPSYINLIFPKYPVTVHAFTNVLDQISPAVWAVNDLGIEHAKTQKPLMGLKDFAKVLIDRGLVTNAKGESVTSAAADLTMTEHYFLKVGS
ncbi:MAG: hypothetical protein H7249_07535 [Chitinophagaceae bacterium]|nr:hypothetical protein [Oligoflexus sp.]